MSESIDKKCETQNELTTLRFIEIGSYGKKGHHVRGSSYPDNSNNRSKIYMVFHDDDVLGVKIFSFEGCKHYVNNFKGLLNLNDSDIIKKEFQELYNLVQEHNFIYKKNLEKQSQ